VADLNESEHDIASGIKPRHAGALMRIEFETSFVRGVGSHRDRKFGPDVGAGAG
jgi:uncharacterized protein involved in copper resistance